jgi:hypothetical protein
MKLTDTVLAGTRTAADWKRLLPRLMSTNAPDAWKMAYEEFYLARLNLRYFNPIRLLQENGTFQGEGFSIVTIQCSLIEFLETTIQGRSYRYLRRNETLGPFEYTKSSEIFTSFLTSREPFRLHFDKPGARDFYENVRCGLLHEARTKGGWRIHARSPEAVMVDFQQKIVFRDDLQVAFGQFLEWYRTQLTTDTEVQTAFIRKYDSLCVD